MQFHLSKTSLCHLSVFSLDCCCKHYSNVSHDLCFVFHRHLVTLPSAPGLPAHKSSRPYTVYELEQVRQHYRRWDSRYQIPHSIPDMNLAVLYVQTLKTGGISFNELNHTCTLLLARTFTESSHVLEVFKHTLSRPILIFN